MGKLSRPFEPVEVGEAEPLHMTDKALLVDIDEVGETWLPLTAIHDESEVWTYPQEAGRLVVKRWLAVGRGWAEAGD